MYTTRVSIVLLMNCIINDFILFFSINNLSRDEDEEMGTLCQCALKALTELLPETKLAPILSHLLLQERADTLSK